MMALKLGRNPSPQDSRDLKLAKYLLQIPDPPDKQDYSAAQPKWAVFLNNEIGDCAIASTGHLVQSWSLQTKGRRARLTNAAILKRYEEVSGYVPGDQSTDTGCNMRDVLKRWLSEPLGGHSLTAFARISVPPAYTGSKAFKQALWALGGVYLGLNLPRSAEDQINRGQPWSDVGDEPGSWGGHAVACLGYSVQGIELITWGRRQLMTWSFLARYGDEAYGLIDAGDWLAAGKSPGGFDLQTLQNDLAAVRAA
jgi:hypothetical protein